MVAARQSEPWNLVTSAMPVEIPFEVADGLLVSGADLWLPHAELAYADERDAALASIGLGGLLKSVRRQVRVTLGPVTRSERSVRRHLTWQAASQARLFPVMEGSVAVTQVSPASCVLEVRAHYQPPLGRAGQLADRALLHLVAGTSIRRFATEVAERLAAAGPGPAQDGQTGPPA